MTGMDVLAVFVDVLRRFEGGGVPYMVVGSVGSIIYGEPRLTKDMDLVVSVKPEQAASFEVMFPFEDFYCPPLEVVREEVIQRGQFNLIHHASGLKIDVIIRGNSPHAVEEFRRRQKIEFWEDYEAYVASAEDIIIKKLEYYREGRSEKHLTDIRGILATTDVDHEYLSAWVERLKLEEFYGRVEG